MIQQTEQLRSSVTSSNAGSRIDQHITSPIILSINNILEIGRTCIGRRNNLQSIKHRTQIMKEKYFCILAYISMRLITMCMSHRQKIWPDRAIHRRANQLGLTEGKSCSRALEVLQTINHYKMVVYWFIQAGGHTPPHLTNLTINHNNLCMTCNIKHNSSKS